MPELLFFIKQMFFQYMKKKWILDKIWNQRKQHSRFNQHEIILTALRIGFHLFNLVHPVFIWWVLLIFKYFFKILVGFWVFLLVCLFVMYHFSPSAFFSYWVEFLCDEWINIHPSSLSELLMNKMKTSPSPKNVFWKCPLFSSSCSL